MFLIEKLNPFFVLYVTLLTFNCHNENKCENILCYFMKLIICILMYTNEKKKYYTTYQANYPSSLGINEYFITSRKLIIT